jgi:hypothetical protein
MSMRHRAVFRFVSALVAVWLAIVLAEPAALHVCAAHDGAPAASAAIDAGQHAGHHVHGAAANAGGEHGDVPATHGCSCLGHCAGSASPVILATTLDGALVVLGSSDRTTAELGFTPLAPAFLLPFANGPPLSVA